MVYITGALILALDLLSKWLVQQQMALYDTIPLWPGVFHITYIRNPGAAFGLLAGQRWLFILVGVVALGAIVALSRSPQARRGVVPLALGLVLGGTVGNLIDRVLRGEVIDMFDFRLINFAIFNVADIGITVGIGLLIIYLLFLEGRQA